MSYQIVGFDSLVFLSVGWKVEHFLVQFKVPILLNIRVIYKYFVCFSASAVDGPSRGRPGLGGGLSGVLGQLNKKNKLSTLEKSKLDWSTYKQDEGIDEEIQSHNKGRNGFVQYLYGVKTHTVICDIYIVLHNE